jgi:hypothetical protein
MLRRAVDRAEMPPAAAKPGLCQKFSVSAATLRLPQLISWGLRFEVPESCTLMMTI